MSTARAHTHTHTHTHTHMSAHIHTQSTHVHNFSEGKTKVCVCGNIYVCMCICVCMCVACVYMCLCVYACVHMRVCIDICIHFNNLYLFISSSHCRPLVLWELTWIATHSFVSTDYIFRLKRTLFNNQQVGSVIEHFTIDNAPVSTISKAVHFSQFQNLGAQWTL